MEMEESKRRWEEAVRMTADEVKDAANVHDVETGLRWIAGEGWAVGVGTRRSGWGCDVSNEVDGLKVRAFGIADMVLAVALAKLVLQQVDFVLDDVSVPSPVVDGASYWRRSR